MNPCVLWHAQKGSFISNDDKRCSSVYISSLTYEKSLTYYYMAMSCKLEYCDIHMLKIKTPIIGTLECLIPGNNS